MESDAEPIVGEIMVPSPVTVSPEATVAHAASLMRERNIGALIVTREQRVVGMFTERDLLRCAAASPSSLDVVHIESVLTPEPVTIPPEMVWDEAMQLMDRRRIRHLPVVSDARLVGMLSIRDLVRHQADQLQRLVDYRTAELAEQHLRMRTSLEQAGRLQQQLMPSVLPVLPPFDFAVTHHPYDHVTGDYYDFLDLGPERIGVLIADASGHGLSAAFVSVKAKTAFRTFGQDVLSPAEALEILNDKLDSLQELDKFVTKLYAVIDRSKCTMTYALAGHCPPLWYRRSTGAVELLTTETGLMIGIVENPEIQEVTIQLEPGDSVLFYTDGTMECPNERREQFGLDGLKNVMERVGHLSSQQILDRLGSELDQFRGEQPFDDDLTAIALSMEG